MSRALFVAEEASLAGVRDSGLRRQYAWSVRPVGCQRRVVREVALFDDRLDREVVDRAAERLVERCVDHAEPSACVFGASSRGR